MIWSPIRARGHREDLLERSARLLAGIVADPDGEFDFPEELACARDASEAAGAYGDPWAELIEMAQRNRVDVPLALAVANQGLDPHPELDAARQKAKVVHLQTSRALGAIAAALDARGVRWAVLKGPAVSRLWPHGALTRTYDDLDLLVSPCDLRETAEVLQGLGYEHRNRNWSGFTDLGVAEIPFDDGSVVVDLHWNLVALADQRRHLRFDTEALLARVQFVELSGCEVPVLCDLDAFTHLCCHAGLAGARNLRMVRDVHLFASRVDPDDARRSLRGAGCDRLAAPVLDRAVRWFGPVTSPDGTSSDAIRLCGHPHWIRLNRLVDRAWSTTSRPHRLTFPGTIVEAGRTSLGATGGALLERLLVATRSRLGLSTPTSPGGRLHWETDHDPDQPAAQERYLRYVWTEGLCS